VGSHGCASAGKAGKPFVILFTSNISSPWALELATLLTERQTCVDRSWPMTFDACTCDSNNCPAFVECRIEAGWDDTK